MATAPKKTYKVFISSTFIDNQERRKVVEDAILSAGMFPVGMERFTASPRPTVKECKRMAAECDVYVGIIAWRYGWIPKGNNYSITETEYKAAKKAGRERLMFVIDPSLPVNPNDDFDPGPDKWEKQKKLDAFKQRFGKDQMPAHFNETTLGTRVLAALIDYRSRHESPSRRAKKPRKSTPRRPADTRLDEEIRAYCAKAESIHANLPVAGFATHLNVPIDVEDIYVPLRAVVDLRGVAEDSYHSAVHAEKCLRGQEADLEISLPEAFRQTEERRRHGVVILGDPGSGKTTHLKRLLLWCIRKGPESIGLPDGMLPVFLPLRELVDLDKGLDAFIQKTLDHPHLGLSKGFGRRLLKRGNLLLLLDGLDEVADLARREKVARWIVEALRPLGTCRFVVTCRYAGYSPTVRLSEGFLEMHIRPLTTDLAERFVHNWYRAVEVNLARDPRHGEALAKEKAEDLISRLEEPEFRARRVFELTRNPLLLTNLCLVHRQRGKLPQKRARLYDECIDVLLEHWRESIGLSVGVDAQAGKRVLQPAALWLHELEGRTTASADQLAPVIDPQLKAVKWESGGARDFLRTVRDVSGLLTGWDQEHYGFMHLGFQEYLAAREIRTQAFSRPEVLRELASHFGESWWQEVGLLLLALEDPSLFIPYVREVVKLPSFADHPQLVEACLDDAAESSPEPFLELVRQAAGHDPERWRRQLLALRILERVDPRVVDELTDKLGRHPSPEIRHWLRSREKEVAGIELYSEAGNYVIVYIPGGSFLMGAPESDEERYDDETPQHEVHCPDFYIGRYAVTNDEYAQFLAENPDVSEPKYWADRRFNQPRRPVVGVSWHEAKRYARWAGLRLPTEAEWEYAARAGTTGARYGDLDEIAWYGKNSGDSTHPVGEKEPNSFGLYDMLGNVWEWVEDDWHSNYEGAPVDGRAWVDAPGGTTRVLRGGSWSFGTGGVRASMRGRGDPDGRGDNVGFRCSRDKK